MQGEDSHHELIAQAVAGDRFALEELLMGHCRRLSQHIGAALPDTLHGVVTVEDLLQETLVDAIEGIRQLQARTERGVFAWLCTIADRRVHDAVRARRQKKRGGAHGRAETAGTATRSSIADLVALLSDRGETPSAPLVRRETVAAVQVGVACLPKDQRVAISLHYLEGKSVAETAATLERTPGAVRGLLHRAKQSLREALGRSSRWFGSG